MSHQYPATLLDEAWAIAFDDGHWLSWEQLPDRDAERLAGLVWRDSPEYDAPEHQLEPLVEGVGMGLRAMLIARMTGEGCEATRDDQIVDELLVLCRLQLAAVTEAVIDAAHDRELCGDDEGDARYDQRRDDILTGDYP